VIKKKRDVDSRVFISALLLSYTSFVIILLGRFSSILAFQIMLAAEKTALSASLHARRLDIKEKDLNNLTVFLDGISTQSALLAGFSFAGLGSVDDSVHVVWKVVLYIFTAVAIGSNMYVLCVGQLTTIFGPTLALNGPTGSIDRAVENMRRERTMVFKMFLLGLIAFYFMVIALSFIHMDTWIAVVSVVILSCFGLFIGAVSSRVLHSFRFEEPELKKLIKVSELEKFDSTMDLGEHDFVPRQDSTTIALRSKGEVSAAEFLKIAQS